MHLWRGGVLRWRLETFGLYMPSLPNRRPWWRPNGRAALALLRHRHAYRDWLLEMRRLRAGGPAAWWEARLGADHDAWRAALDGLNRPEAAESPM